MNRALGLAVIVAIAIAMCAQSAIALQGLVGYWSFNDCTANDSSGRSNHGLLVGNPVCDTGVVGSGMRFNALNYVDIANSASLQVSSSFTISVWFRADVLTPNYPLRIVDKITAGTADGYMISVRSDGIGLSGGPSGAFASVPISAGVSHHVAVTLNQGAARFFLDGVFVGAGSIGSTSVEINNLPVRIGASQGVNANTNANFSGVIDEVQIFDRALSDSEVTTLTGAVSQPTVIAVTPTVATVDSSTTLSVVGSNLGAGLGFVFGDCTPADSEVFDATTSDTLRKFRCTPRGSPGLKYGRVKSSPTGTTLANFTVEVVANLGANEVASFVFDGPISDQQTGSPFSVRVRAVNSNGTTVSGFNGAVRLSRVPSATLSRSTLQFSSGEWSGQAAVLTSGVGKLIASYQRGDRTTVQGVSTDFEVSGMSDRLAFTVSGRTLPTVTAVQLVKTDDATTLSTTVGADGKFQFLSVAKGKYRVQVVKPGFRQITQIAEFNVAKDTTLPPIELSDRSRYVLLLPGMMGSTLRSTGDVNTENLAGIVVAPTLPVNESCSAAEGAAIATSLKLYEPTVLGSDVVGWAQMRTFLRALGFQVVDVPWDWRCTAKEAATAYLKAAVEQVRLQDSSAEISIVAHSMGGLVAREYIQSSAFAGEVSNLVMLGTPNAGATKAYFLMEGGDPGRSDGWGTGQLKAVYENAIESLYKTQGNFTLVGKSATFKRDFIRETVSGGFDLMPVYPFLRRGSLVGNGLYALCREQSGATVQSLTCDASNTNACNPNLVALNGNTNLSRFVPFTQTPTTTQVRTKLYLSNSDRDTDYIVNYCSSNQAGNAYDHGVPAVMTTDSGDGTVRSALGLAFAGSMQDIGDYGSHPSMPKRLAEAVALLLSGFAPSAAATFRPVTATTVVSTNSQLQVRGDGAVDLLMQLPDGAVTGTSDQGVVTEISGRSEVVNFNLLRAINVSDPANGRYSLTLRAPTAMLRALQTLRVTISDAANGGDVWLRLLPRQMASLIQFDLAKEANTPVVPVDVVLPATHLAASRGATGVTLNWTASADPTVTGYRIFVRENAKSVYELLGETAATSFATNLQWASSREDLLHFVVLGVNTNGDESFVKEGNYTTNESYIAASFASSATNQSLAMGTTLPVAVSFVDQSKSSSPIISWSWDFNGDGSPDSAVQNPTYVFDSYGQYTVTLTVTSDDGTDTRIQAFAVNIVPCAPLQQSMTCTLDVNGDGRTDSRDGLLILRRLLGFSGSALTDSVVNASCGTASTQATIADFVDNQIANGHYNIDGGIGGGSAASSGLLIYRALQGLTDNAVTGNAIRPGATRTTWTGAGQIREYLNTQCGAGL